MMTLSSSILSGCTNTELFERMYALYMSDPMSVDGTWRDLFDGVESSFPRRHDEPVSAKAQISLLIDAYRRYGYLIALIDPLGLDGGEEPEELSLHRLGFQGEDLQKTYPFSLPGHEGDKKLAEIIAILRQIYCGSFAVEYMDRQGAEMESWLQQQIEPTLSKAHLQIEAKQSLLQHLNRSELFEVFLHTKYVGQKRFSLEGAETLIPMLVTLIEEAAEEGAEQFVLGMSHRGRLNVLSNILDKSYRDIFIEFDPHHLPPLGEGSGDVKYHKGYAVDKVTSKGVKIHIELIPNPSHLEAVDPVVEGQARARQQRLGGGVAAEKKVLPILIHGDAALAGQGVVYETLQMGRLQGYSTGGTVHLIVNNQIGFTTVPKDGRSTRYCSDIAKTFGAPVFHVNAEDPESCLYATHLALQMRQKFACDVFIDLVCYRKYGHNESDEPAFTQPLEYQIIRKKRPIRELYRDELIKQGILEKAIAEELEGEFKNALQKALQGVDLHEEASSLKQEKISPTSPERVVTAVPLEILRDLSKRFCSVPADFQPHAKIQDLYADRLKMVEASPEEKKINWGMGEILAYATLLAEGKHVRLSGQDCCRGTFSHRHAVVVDQKCEKSYVPLSHLQDNQGLFEIYNSLLSEYGVLGFEYGYSMVYKDALVLWEAQFGDFCNGAQIIIDQFIATSEQKWGKNASIVLLLPHGYEGQGPEHSSARMERFLSLAGDDNMQIVNPSTPAQFFHLLRRHVLRQPVKPLVVFTPKVLLRHSACLSSLNEFSTGAFQAILDDPRHNPQAKKIVLCNGKIFYEIDAQRVERKDHDLALIRIEQLYPLHEKKLKEILQGYADAEEFLWVQEEPSNMGAWDFISSEIPKILPIGKTLKYVGRERSASPATGSHALHEQQLQAIMKKIFT